MGKKKKQKDFQKIKLKVGRKLKRSNETKTEFKTKKIIIKEAESILNDPIRALFNTNLTTTQAKLSCLNKLNNSINNIDFKYINGELMNALCKYLVDNDSRIRQETINCIKQCLNILENKNTNIDTLLCILMTYLNCALTHINQSICSDGFKLLNLIVNKCQSVSFEQLIKIMMTRLTRTCHESVHVNDYDILGKIITKITKQHGNSLDDKSLSQRNEPQMKWTRENSSVNLNLLSGYKQPPQFNITFQATSSVDSKKEFLLLVQSIVINDIKVLFAMEKNFQLSLSVKEARKFVSALNIAVLLKYNNIELKRKPHSINITSTSAENKLSKKEKRVINNLKNELNTLIEKLFESISFNQ